MSRRTSAVLGLVAAVSLLPLTACGGGGEDGYRLTALFDSSVGLYEHGDVHVMGIPVGSVESIDIDGTTVRVEIVVDDDVPLPDDVQATIGQSQLIGERNVVLFPPWDAEHEASGAGKAADGDVIPTERTVEAIEPDEGLQAFNDLAKSLDTDAVNGFIADSRTVLEGRGEKIGAAIDQAAGLGTTLAEVDQQLLSAAENLHVLAGTLADRDQQLGQLVDRFSVATDVLAQERDGIGSLLSSLVELTSQGKGLLDAYGGQLPGDIANATAFTSILSTNVDSIDSLLQSLPPLAIGIGNAYRPELDALYLRASITPTLQALLDALTGPLGLGGLVQLP